MKRLIAKGYRAWNLKYVTLNVKVVVHAYTGSPRFSFTNVKTVHIQGTICVVTTKTGVYMFPVDSEIDITFNK